MLSKEQKLLCCIAHLGWVVGFPVLIPLIIMLLASDEFVRTQAREAMFFQIGVIILCVVFGILSFILIGIPFMILLSLGTLIFPILAVVRISKGIDYSYPVTGIFARKI